MSAAISARKIAIHYAGSWREWLSLILHLGKTRISLLASLSTATGYFLATGDVALHMLVPTTAVFLIACGSCGLNQYQDREIDRFMERTKSRPIPSGKMTPETALSISLGLTLAGLFILLYEAEKLALGLGLFAVLWYNSVYTPLKKRTAFATLPGALVGAIPPLLGWVSGGGDLFDRQVWGVALFFYIWQVPHFWLLLLGFAADYRKAGIPSLTSRFTAEQMKAIIFIWILSTGACCLLLPLFSLVKLQAVLLALFTLTFWLVGSAVKFIAFGSTEGSFRPMFSKLNIYALLVISFLSLDRLLGK